MMSGRFELPLPIMPLDVQKHATYWMDGANEAIETAELLVNHGRYTFGLFFMHLALEKTLKALVTRHTCETPAKTHDLLFLSRKAELVLPDEVSIVLSEFQVYCLAGRYPGSPPVSVDKAMAHAELLRARGAYQWLRLQLSK